MTDSSSPSPPSVSSFRHADRAGSVRVGRAAEMGAAGVTTLLDMLGEPSWAIRREVIAALAVQGDLALPDLLSVLEVRRDNETVNAAAMDAIAASSGDPTAGLLKLADHQDPAVAADATQLLGRRGARAAIPQLARLANGPNDNVAVAAIEALGRIGGRATVESLVSLIKSGNFFRTFPAIDVLGRSGDPRAIGPLAALLADARYALEAARALGRTGERTAATPLADLLAAQSPSTIRVAACAIEQLSHAYAERYGVEGAIDNVVAAAAPVSAAKALGAALRGATPEEQTAIAHVLGMLNDPEARRALSRMVEGAPAVATMAARRLSQLQDAKIELGAILRNGSSARRAAVLPVASMQSLDPADVVACLFDPDGKVRSLAAETLATLGARQYVPQLFELLDDPNPRVSQAAVSAIDALQSPDTELLVNQMLAVGSVRARCATLRVVRQFGFRSALAASMAAARDEDERLCEGGLLALAAIDDPSAEDFLTAELRLDNARRRSLAARALGQRTPSSALTQALLDASSDSDAWVRYYATRSLAHAHPSVSAAAVDRLEVLLDDEAAPVRLAAIESLAHHASDRAHERLARASESSEEDVRRAAVMSLGIGKRPESLPHLARALESEDASTRLVAVAALDGFTQPSVVGLLARAAADPDPSVSSTAVGLLANFSDEPATLALAAISARDPANARARLALSASTPGRIHGLLRALESADDESALVLVSALVRMRTSDGTQGILSVLCSPNVAARKAAATVLASVPSDAATGALRDAANSDPDPEVKRLCALALSSR